MIDLFEEIVLTEITPTPCMSRTGGHIGHRAWHAEAADRVMCGASCSWLDEWERLKGEMCVTQKFRDEVEARAARFRIRFR